MTVSTNDLVRDIVYETVAQHLGLKIDEVKEDMDASKDSSTFYRIIVDIEQRLGLSSSEGDWVFEEASIQGLEDYYKNQTSRQIRATASNYLKSLGRECPSKDVHDKTLRL